MGATNSTSTKPTNAPQQESLIDSLIAYFFQGQTFEEQRRIATEKRQYTQDVKNLQNPPPLQKQEPLGGKISNPKYEIDLTKSYKILLFFTYFSPIIVTSLFLSLSFFYQNYKGFIYLGFILAACIIRAFLYYTFTPYQTRDCECNKIYFQYYGNAMTSPFIFAFTIMYIMLPMIINQSFNPFVLTGLVLYCLLDFFTKYACYAKNQIEVFLNYTGGLMLAAIFVACMYGGGSMKYLFFNEFSTGIEVCNKPDNQTFKCSVYQNGELISGDELQGMP